MSTGKQANVDLLINPFSPSTTTPKEHAPIGVLMLAGGTRRMSFGVSLEIVQADSQFPMRIVETVDRRLSPK